MKGKDGNLRGVFGTIREKDSEKQLATRFCLKNVGELEVRVREGNKGHLNILVFGKSAMF